MPSGLPDIDDFTATYGGAKVNYAPVEDSTTDEDAGIRNLYAMNAAMMTGTAVRGWVRFTSAATTGALVLVAHMALWGNAANVVPTLSHSATGVITITLPTTITDQLGIVHTINLRAAWANSRGGGTFYQGEVVPTSANVLTVYLATGAGSASDAVGTDFDVFYF